MQQQTAGPQPAKAARTFTIKTSKPKNPPAPSARRASEQRERRHREQAIASWLRSLVRDS